VAFGRGFLAPNLAYDADRGTMEVIILDNLKEGVLTSDIYEPALDPPYPDVPPVSATYEAQPPRSARSSDGLWRFLLDHVQRGGPVRSWRLRVARRAPLSDLTPTASTLAEEGSCLSSAGTRSPRRTTIADSALTALGHGPGAATGAWIVSNPTRGNGDPARSSADAQSHCVLGLSVLDLVDQSRFQIEVIWNVRRDARKHVPKPPLIIHCPPPEYGSARSMAPGSH
jgi:hypothetical protein